MHAYLAATDYINWQHSAVLKKALKLAQGLQSDEEVANKCFEFVRDEIKHSNDFKLNPVTCRASDVLEYGTGYCYAKSHLLAALLRANGIPAGLMYQRLEVSETDKRYCLHGLNAVYLKQYGWYRIDARGNKLGVNALFRPPIENLAFPILLADERDLPEIWDEPLPLVVKVLTTYKTVDDVLKNLPDIPLVKFVTSAVP